MPTFIYKAKNSSGEPVKGEREAADKYELYKILKEEGTDTISVEEKKNGAFGFLSLGISFGGKVKMQEKITFARNLGLMLEAGLTLTRALSVLERQSKNKNFKKIMNSLIGDLDMA